MKRQHLIVVIMSLIIFGAYHEAIAGPKGKTLFEKYCVKCHGVEYRHWRMGIHGKRIGSWIAGGKKRWWVCTECHNPHTVQINRFRPLKPEPAPALPKGMKNAAHESVHAPSAGGHGEATPAATH